MRFLWLFILTNIPLSILAATHQNTGAVQNADQAAQIVNDAAESHFEGNMDVEHQKDGKFPRLERQHTLGAIQRVWDKAPNQAGVYAVTYSQEQLIKIRLREFMTTTVVLPSWEVIEEIIIGDSSTFEAVQKANHILLLRCKEFVERIAILPLLVKVALFTPFMSAQKGITQKIFLI